MQTYPSGISPKGNTSKGNTLTETIIRKFIIVPKSHLSEREDKQMHPKETDIEERNPVLKQRKEEIDFKVKDEKQSLKKLLR